MSLKTAVEVGQVKNSLLPCLRSHPVFAVSLSSLSSCHPVTLSPSSSQAVVASQSQTIEVGLTKVQIVKELAQGGFGVVYLVQDAPKKDKGGG